MTITLIIYAILVLGLLAAELRENRQAQMFLKPLAAGGFLIIALQSGALDSLYGQIIFAGLVFCALGDVLLLSRSSEKLFIAGMAAFGFGHLAYLSAFVPFETDNFGVMRFVINGMIIGGTIVFFNWLKPMLPAAMKWPVIIYSGIIMFMVLNAVDLPLTLPLVFAMIAAIMFAVSDMFVARDRFVKRDPVNALAITPLYFGAQALFALSVAT
ncbi:lysoplasmalogenase [Litorimonas sp. RW-G-Af-16]|uniref:lysoplasmalogenase n=1 Tax=Litorimonas sp. RW-G-Af-16 TaxID=3241168 RepID=UPI00390CD9D8